MKRHQLDVDIFDPALIEDPYPMYEEIRSVGNVVWNPAVNAWMVVGYDEAMPVMASNGDRFATMNGDPEVIFWFEAPNMITVDGSYHRRLRGALAPLFTKAAIAKWEPRINEVVEQLLTPLASAQSSFDLIADFTMLPTIIIADMMGVTEDRYGDFQRWSHAIVTNLGYGARDPARHQVMKQTAVEINAYVQEEIERHRRDEPDDLLTTMLAQQGDDAMSDDEIRSTAVLLLLAGYDTTAKAMTDCLIALERNPEQRRRVVDDFSLVPAAIEEGLRWYGPVQSGRRQAVTDVVLGGEDISAGDLLYVLHGAANRDPRRWPAPERFDLDREQKTHLAFGYGPHLCLGAPLARLEVQVAIEQLLRVAPEYHLRDVDFGNSFFVRGPERGIVDLEPPREPVTTG